MRALYTAVVLLCAGPLVAGCGDDSEAPGSEEIFLHPLAAAGAGPFTTSTATADTLPALPVVASAPKSPSGAGVTLRTVSGAQPGLYAGEQQKASCDVRRQAGLLVADKARTRAFAEAADVDRTRVAAYLEELTPVVLRADTRVTDHAFDDGAAVARQSVLQAGTAVLVDQFGAPRVRCASGAPLKPPVAARAATVTKGEPWFGYRADRTVVIKPATQAVNNLLLVSIVDNGWIERPAGTGGEDDARPAVLPPVDPADVFADPARTAQDQPADAAGAQRESPAPQPPAPASRPPVEPAPQPDLPDPPDVVLPDLPDDQPLQDVGESPVPDLPAGAAGPAGPTATAEPQSTASPRQSVGSTPVPDASPS